MKLRTKTGLIIIICFGILLSSLYGVSKYSLMGGFSKIEHDDANNKALLITDSVNAIKETLSSKAADWAAWDDAYEFVQDKNQKFVESNFAENALLNLKIDILVYLDEKGKPAKLAAYDLENEKTREFPESLKKHIASDSQILKHSDAESLHTGILNLPEGFLVFASRPVVDSEMVKPIKGTAIFARFLSPKQIQKLSDLTHQKISQYNYDSSDLPTEILWAKSNFKETNAKEVKAASQVINQNLVNGYALMYDFYGKPAVIYKSEIDRVIYSQGEKSLNTLLWMIFAAVFVIGAVLILTLDKTVLSRLIRMTSEVESIDNNANKRVTAEGTDEITSLAQKVNTMLVSIEDNTQKVKKVSETISTMLNSVTQGFFLFNKDGVIDSNYSLACEKLFEQKPAGQHLAKVLNTPVQDINEWLEQLFLELIDFSSLSELGPKTFKNNQGLSINLEYHPVRNANNELVSVVCIATDVTNELAAKKELEEQKVFADRVTKIAKSKNDFIFFVNETRKLIDSAQNELTKNHPDVAALYRYVHTLKGGAGAFSLVKVQDFAHQFENELGTLRNSTPGLLNSKISELQFNLTELKNLFESNINEHADLLGASALDGENRVEIPFSRLKGFYELIKKSTPYEKLEYKFLADFISQPISKSFDHYNEVVQHLSQRLGKMTAPIHFENANLMICHEPYRELFTSLVHVFRNIVDHGIETPEDRDASGKDIEGHINVKFNHVKSSQGEFLKIQIQDDGRGIDISKIRSKLAAQGVDVTQFNDRDLIQKIFESGFSTADKVTETSGRGVGMDAIKKSCLNIDGDCSVESEPNKGTLLTIVVPYFTGFDKSSVNTLMAS